VERGDVSQCSFGFDILDEELMREDGNDVWHICKVKLYEVSICTFPAYAETEVKTRQNELETIKKRKAEAWRSEMLKKLKGEKDA
jgi:HK97 family phage prohead protease